MNTSGNSDSPKKRVAIVLPSNIRYAPYYRVYEEIFVRNNIPFDLIIWNREGIIEDVQGLSYEYCVKDRVNSGSLLKIFRYFGFAGFVKRVLKSNDYNKIIFLGTNAGTVSIMSDVLRRKWKNQYWIDIRDYTFENIKLYRMKLETAIKNSFATAISSEGYKAFLPQYNYLLIHNIDSKNIDEAVKIRKERFASPTHPIRISFIGLVRYYNENKKFINALGNDNRFVLQYYGQNSEVLKSYCEEKSIRNVDFLGRFEPSQTASLYKRTDIINNIYGHSSLAVSTALSNKLYFAAALNIPILVSPNTFMEKITKEYGFGYSVDLNAKNLGDDLYFWYKNYMQQDKQKGNSLLNKAYQDNKNFENELLKFINN